MATLTLVSARIYGEEPSGLINGANTVYTATSTFFTGTQVVYRNGQQQAFGVGCDYTLAESSPGLGFDQVVFSLPPKAGDNIHIDYTRC